MSMSRLIRHGLSAAACSVGLLLLPVSPVASEERGRAGAALGDVHFPTSCTPAAQQQFDRAVAILHSFWYEEAVKAFTGVTRTDPSCAMGYWGVAMSHWYPLWYPPGEDALKAGSSAAEQARAVGAKTPRERDYVAAVAAFYEDWGKLDHRTRSLAYEKAMEHVHATYPDDREAGVFYALALNATATFLLCKAFGPGMLARGRGKIINVGSTDGIVGVPEQVAYCASKGAVVQITKTLGAEWIKHGVNVNAIGPCDFDTPMIAGALDEPEYADWIVQAIPAGRIGQARELAGAAVYLASDASDMVAGHMLMVDGGRTII